MTRPNHDRRVIREALTALAGAHARSIAEIEQAIDSLARVLQLQETGDILSRRPMRGRRSTSLHVDRGTLSIVWRGHTCFVGNTLLFRFIERLARTPNCYVSHVDLLDEVWGAERESSTIRGLAKRLRDRLVAAGMPDLAGAIDGSVTGYYGLKLV